MAAAPQERMIDVTQVAIAEVRDRIREIEAENNPTRKNELIDTLLQELLEQLQDKNAEANDVRQGIVLVGQGLQIPTDLLNSAKLVELVMVKLFEVIRSRLFTRENLQRLLNTITGQRLGEYLRQLLQNIDDVTIELLVILANKGATSFTASFFQELIARLGDSDDHQRIKFEISQMGQPQTKFEEYFNNLTQNNRRAAKLLGEAVLDLAQSRGGNLFGISLDELRKRFLVNEPTIEELRRQQLESGLGGEAIKRSKIIKLIEDDLRAAGTVPGSEIEQTANRAIRLVNSLESVNSFYQFYENEIRFEQAQIGQATPDQLEEIAKRVDKKIHSTTLYVVNTIYRNVLNDNREPRMTFDQASQVSDPYYNPAILYRYFADRLVSLKSASAREQTTDRPLPFYTYKRTVIERYNAETKHLVKDYGITPELVKTNITEFLTELEAISETELNLIEYGYNFRYATLYISKQQEKSLFANIAAWAENRATSDAFDRLKVLQDNDLITAAQTAIMTYMGRSLAERGHIKSREIAEELFTREGKLLGDVAKKLAEDYPEIDSWRRTRALRHAMTRVFGAEFMFQLWMSYADPPVGFAGEEDISGMNSVFLWQEAAMRWGFNYAKHDNNFKGAIFFPHRGKVEDFDHDKLVAQGEKVWKDMIRNGYIACFDSPYFYDKNTGEPIIPIIATPGNVTEMGGPNQVGGWRVTYGLIPIIKEYLSRDPRHEYTFNLTGVDGIFSKIWKKIENSGVNNIRVLFESGFISNEVFNISQNGESLQYESQFEDLCKFLYRRYFKEGVGATFISANLHDQTGEAFWQSIKSKLTTVIKDKHIDSKKRPAEILKIFSSIVYQAMTVMVYERTPTEFLVRPRIRDEQNGITPAAEMRHILMNQPGPGQTPWTEQDWKMAYDDLEYAQMEARRNITSEINNQRQQWGNLFGDLASDRSAVRGGRGYVLDRDYIKELLVKKYLGRGRNLADPNIIHTLLREYDALPADNEYKKKIENVLLMHRTLEYVLIRKPILESKIEQKWRQVASYQGTDKEELKAKEQAQRALELADAWKRERICWFADAWQNNIFNGIPFILDKNWEWETESLGDKNTVSRTAGAIVTTAELVNHNRQDRADDKAFIVLAKDSVRKGPDIWSQFKSYINGFRKTLADNLDPELVSKIGEEELRRYLYILVRDDKYRNIFGEVYGRLMKKGKLSLGADAWINLWGHDFSASDLRAFLQVLVKDNALKPEDAERIAVEFDATWLNVIGEVAPKVAIALFGIILLSYLKKSYEEEVERKT